MKVIFAYPGNVAADAFPDVNTLQNCLNAYFTEGTVEQELIEKQYESVHDLLVHIKKTGTDRMAIGFDGCLIGACG